MIHSGQSIAPPDATGCSSWIRLIASIRYLAIRRRALKRRQSNSKLYARIDHKRSFVMFGDFDTGMDAPLSGYCAKTDRACRRTSRIRRAISSRSPARVRTRRLRAMSFPAAPWESFNFRMREILPGSEIVTLELRDRRNPEVNHFARNADPVD